MTRRVAHLLAVGAITLLAGCGVSTQFEPEPLPSTEPAVLPPSVTQEPAATTTPPPPSTPASPIAP
ncbi:MAG TPA: hypothetical protein VK935_22410 [Actinomycetospora sp.]|nr:hypothetical protein [Actinomycetospora sp.]